MKVIEYIKMWNRWRKRSLNGLGHKILVLFGLRESPTFEVEKSFNILFRKTYDRTEEDKKDGKD